jgi:hypothetical protein
MRSFIESGVDRASAGIAAAAEANPHVGTQIGDGGNELLRWRSRNSSPNENGARAIAERLNGLAVG